MVEAPTIGEYVVVRNHEHQYSVWWSYRDLPAGWESTGYSGSREECLVHINTVWTDMRPLSLRTWMGQEFRPAALDQQ